MSSRSGVDVSFDLGNKKESKNLSGQTYVKDDDDDIANMNDFDAKNHSGSVIKVCCAFLYVCSYCGSYPCIYGQIKPAIHLICF